MKPKALYLLEPGRHEQVYDLAERAKLEQLLAFIAPPQSSASYSALGNRLSEVEVIVTSWGMPAMNHAFLQRFPRLRIVFYGAGSVRSFVTEASWARGVRVVNASAANAVPAAEYSFAQIVLSLKRVWALAAVTRRDRGFNRQAELIPGIFGSTVGLLALGSIGRLVAERLRTLDVSIIAYDPLMPQTMASAWQVQLCPLDEIFTRADVVSCHLPLLPETDRLIRGAHFQSMKPGASFINTARGAVVAEDEMIGVLRQRPDLTAVLDVTEPEPPPRDSPLFELPNVVLTPHIAGCVGRECRRLGRVVGEEVARYVRGEALQNEVTRELVATLA